MLVRMPFAGQRRVKGERDAWRTASRGGTLDLDRETARPRDQAERRHAMAFHPDVILTLSELVNQERVRDAVRDRLAARAEAATCARPTLLGATWRAAVSWPTGWLRHLRGAKRVHVPAPQARSAAPSVQ